jgi:hypothetical protein
MKQLIVAAVLIIAGVAGAYFYLRTTTYYPVVRLAAPEGYTVTVVQGPVANRERCDFVNRAFTNPLQKSCPACKLEFAHCETTLTDAERALVSGEPLADYAVGAAGIRMLLTGPASAVKTACEQIAVDMVRAGTQSAACAYPGTKR